ncbi:hypothetical protein EB796_004185 [Bugula neritina]|uniref:Uncharacterized protein n=1 Tax=Bugula neritina TaxID=10212 RepID=A0A7J7KH13_BUGNE|nr:hypothetical protein EB796_004185 [Bugula neritina]
MLICHPQVLAVIFVGVYTQVFAELEAGPVYHVAIKYPDWLSDSYLTHTPTNGLTFTHLDADYGSLNNFYIQYFVENTTSEIFFTIQAAFNHKFIQHYGVHTRHNSIPQFMANELPLVDAGDHRLFTCLQSICDHKGAVPKVPGTELYLNGEGKTTPGLSFGRVNYMTFLASEYSQNQAHPTGHVGIDWAVGKHSYIRNGERLKHLNQAKGN